MQEFVFQQTGKREIVKNDKFVKNKAADTQLIQPLENQPNLVVRELRQLKALEGVRILRLDGFYQPDLPKQEDDLKIPPSS